MSQFTTPAVLELLDHYKWRLVEPFTYYTEELNTDNPNVTEEMAHIDLHDEHNLLVRCAININVPANYITDLTSVPRILWSVFPPNGRYAKAAIVHDYLYSNALGNKAWADAVFLEAMTVLGVPKWRRTVMYWAVRLFGRGAYSQ